MGMGVAWVGDSAVHATRRHDAEFVCMSYWVCRVGVERGRAGRNHGVLRFVGSVMVISWYWAQVLVTKCYAGWGDILINRPIDPKTLYFNHVCYPPLYTEQSNGAVLFI